MADFTGFTFNGVHSSDLGFKVVSSGNRYNENIMPSFKDETVGITGGDGTLYWQSYYDKKQWSLNIAFDSMTEVQRRKFKQIFNARAIGALVFDEEPYKTYVAKIQTSPQIKFICFDDGEDASEQSELYGEITSRAIGARVYKGEGTIQFIAYTPFAQCVKKYGTGYSDTANSSQWLEASGILAEQGSFDTWTSSGGIWFYYLYNPGDMEADWTLSINGLGTTTTLKLQKKSEGDTPTWEDVPGDLMTLSSFSLASGDYGAKINSGTELVQGVNAQQGYTGKLYNEFVSGAWFKIPVNSVNSTSASIADAEYRLCVQGANPSSWDFQYFYYYY